MEHQLVVGPDETAEDGPVVEDLVGELDQSEAYHVVT